MARRTVPYGPFQRRLFRRLEQQRLLDQAGFAEELGFRMKREISPMNVTHWKQGTQHFPMDCLVPLAEYIDDDEGQCGVQLVFGGMLRELGHKAVPIEAPEAPAVDPSVAAYRVMREASDVMAALIQAQDPDGPGGAALTREEAARLKPEVAQLRRALEILDDHCDDLLGAAPSRRAS